MKKPENKEVTDIVGKLIEQVRIKNYAEGDNLNLDNKALIQLLDHIVSRCKIPKHICTTSSVHVKRDRGISEEYAQFQDGPFLVRAVAKRKLGMVTEDMDWTAKECAEFYEQEKLWAYKFDDVMRENAKRTQWGGREHCIDIVRWRWDNGLMFGGYSERVARYVKTHVITDEENVILEKLRVIEDLNNIVSILENDLDVILDSDLLSTLSPHVKSAITDVRLNLDIVSLKLLAEDQKDKDN